MNQRCHIYDELKLTIDGVSRELTGEQLRVRALQDELSKLINVHRWRKLADTNTDAYDMVVRVHQLTKALIDKSSAVEARDSAIQQKEKMYVNLRRVVSRQPGTEAMEQLRMYATTLREKKQKLKVCFRTRQMLSACNPNYLHPLTHYLFAGGMGWNGMDYCSVGCVLGVCRVYGRSCKCSNHAYTNIGMN